MECKCQTIYRHNIGNRHGLGQELEPNRKLFPDHLPFILHGALVNSG